LGCKAIEQKILYGIDANNVHILTINNKSIILVEQLLWGGPQAAIIIEELSHLGVTKIIGVGACGSLSTKFCKGDIVYDGKAFITDGTSKNYTKEKSINVFKDIISTIENKNCKKAFSATIDALYQETYEAIQEFKNIGAEIINMESAVLYSVSEKLNIISIWIGCISDVLFENKWDSWFDSKAATIKSAETVKEFAYDFFK
jgi:uridine phosphorylase